MRALRLVIGACAVGLFTAARAEAQRVDVGVKAGLINAGMVSHEIPISTGRALGMSEKLAPGAGVFLALHLNRVFALQPEVLYLPKGGEWDALGASVDVKLSYVEVPLLLRAALPLEGWKVQPVLFAGPAVAFRASCEVSGQASGISATLSCSSTAGLLEFRSADAGIVLGAGLEVPLGKVRASFEARVDLGLANIASGNAASTVHNRAYGGFVGLAVPLGSAPAETLRTR